MMKLSVELIGIWWYTLFFFFSSRRRHTRLVSDWSSDVCSSDLTNRIQVVNLHNQSNSQGEGVDRLALPRSGRYRPVLEHKRLGSTEYHQSLCVGLHRGLRAWG